MTGRRIKTGIPSFYSTTQVQIYLQKIKFYDAQSDVSLFQPNFRNLERLVRLHLITFPMENIPLHYSSTHEVDVNPDYVYKRLVEDSRGGSWCCGQNGLFLGMLRGLGYRAYAVAGRVSQSPPSPEEPKAFTFLSHLFLHVQIDELHADSIAQSQRIYVVDVGFGGTGLVRPIPLEVGSIVPGAAPPEEHRMVRSTHPESSLQESESSRVWALQHRCGSHQPYWSTLYIFDDNETYPSDWIALSQWLSAHPVPLFTDNVFAVRHFVIGDTSQQSDGNEIHLGRLVMMNRRVQRRVGAESVTVKEFSTEGERIKILREDFGILVEEHEIPNATYWSAGLPA